MVKEHLRGLGNGVDDLSEPIHRAGIPESNIGQRLVKTTGMIALNPLSWRLASRRMT